ncbi:hypothetical protein [Marinilabilia salmonicolor]|uniref:hypothetical protein n=1 Tax=Marinilabilia salmonicolor TaxID=989 RepID=UPI00029B4E40|nr:hypothetical protein [Marinilabilia salmonicolor]
MRKIFKISISSIGVIIGLILVGLIIYRLNYYKERNKIHRDLDKLPGVKVIEIWGHPDTKLEEISALIDIEKKGQIVITNLNKDDYNYPEHVSIPYIDGYKFKSYNCDKILGISSSISIGSNDILGKKIGLLFNSPIDIINNYDTILRFVNSLPKYPDLGHYFGDNNEELFLKVQSDKEINTKDPLFDLVGIENDFEFAKTLDWTNKKCIK